MDTLDYTLTFDQWLAMLENMPSIPLDARERIEKVIADNFPTNDFNWSL